MVDNLINTGSEDNSLFIYYKKISSPMLTYKFPVRVHNNFIIVLLNYHSILQVSDDVTKEEYVSAVCWKKVVHFSLIKWQ